VWLGDGVASMRALGLGVEGLWALPETGSGVLVLALSGPGLEPGDKLLITADTRLFLWPPQHSQPLRFLSHPVLLPSAT
jgi:hypothetical protein